MIQEESKIRNLLTVGIPLAIAVFITFFIGRKYMLKKKPDLIIGILQTISHPALDRARAGFLDLVKKKLKGKNVAFIYQNGEGSIPQLHSMAKSLHTKADAFYAIGTPAAQTLANVEKKKPIVISAITDPKAAGLRRPGSNVCGTSDMINIPNQIKMLKALIPTAKKVALIYNPGEINSVTMVKKMEEEIENQNLIATKVGIASESELGAAIIIAAKKADVLLTPLDNLIVGAMPTVAGLSLKAKKALIVSDNPSVERGALASAGVDYYECGKLSGKIMLQVLFEDKNPMDIPIQQPEKLSIIVNQKTLDSLKLSIPESLKQHVKLIK